MVCRGRMRSRRNREGYGLLGVRASPRHRSARVRDLYVGMRVDVCALCGRADADEDDENDEERSGVRAQTWAREGI